MNDEKECLCKVCKPFKDQPEIKYINKQSEIERLEKENAELKEELKKKDQIIEKAEYILRSCTDINTYGWVSYRLARQYFQDKDKE